MTFYQELQVNQAGSKKIIRESASQREKLEYSTPHSKPLE